MEQDQPEKVTKEVNEIITKNGDTEKLTIGEDKCEIPPGMKEVRFHSLDYSQSISSRSSFMGFVSISQTDPDVCLKKGLGKNSKAKR